MNYLKYAAWTTFVLAIVVVTFAIKLKLCKNEPNQQTTYEAVKITTDSIIVVNVDKPDSAKLQVIQNLKLRIAKARFLDSLQRSANNR